MFLLTLSYLILTQFQFDQYKYSYFNEFVSTEELSTYCTQNINGCGLWGTDYYAISGKEFSFIVDKHEDDINNLNEHFKNNKELSIYAEKFKKSWAYKELHEARNVKPSFSWGLILGIIFTGIDQILFRGKLPFTLKHKHADHEALKPASKIPKIEYPKPDGKLTFDKLTNVSFSSTYHEENQPCHLKLTDDNIPISNNLELYDSPEQRYCPAGVYEVLTENEKPRLQINSQNCIHCKTCDIKDPSQNITWKTPQGGEGPNYSTM